MPVLPNARHERFAQGVAMGQPAAEAYEAAGYRSKRHAAAANAWRLLTTNAAVRERIAELKQRGAERAEITIERWLQEVARVGFFNMARIMRIGADGDPYLDLSQITEDEAAAIAEFTVEDFKDGRAKDAREVRRIRVKTHNKLGALAEIGKHLGIAQRHELTGRDGGPIETTDTALPAVARRVAFLLAKAAKQS
jgi:phage terminase small subunit